eukprot:5640543-Pleurochrysis_carterae.AAC.2
MEEEQEADTETGRGITKTVGVWDDRKRWLVANSYDRVDQELAGCLSPARLAFVASARATPGIG